MAITDEGHRYWAAAAVDTAIGEGKIHSSNREAWVDRFADDPDRWAPIIEALTPFPELAPSARARAGQAESPDDALMRAMGYA